MAEAPNPIVAPPGTPPAAASHPDTALDPRYHVYEANPAPWWVGLAWIGFFVFGVVYLIRNLVE